MEHLRELPLHRRPVAGQQHPQVLDRGAAARVVEVDEMRPALCAVVDPQHVADVHVAVQADRRDATGAVPRAAHAVEREP